MKKKTAVRDEEFTEQLDELKYLIEWMDDDLDANAPTEYHDQPLAQDWARVAKIAEEAGEVVSAFIGVTGQNPRKGRSAELQDLIDELADVTLTGLYAIQHFTRSSTYTIHLVLNRARYHRARRVNNPEPKLNLHTELRVFFERYGSRMAGDEYEDMAALLALSEGS